MTENIIIEVYDKGYYITDITMMQQQLEDLRPTGKLTLIEE